jgi:Ni/Fe-hydrogenase 1 B-type cytochrome subunit
MSADSSGGTQYQAAVYVYEAPVRLWHWVNALAIVILAISGYLIGSPLPTLSGEASAHYQMGYLRFAHFASGEVLAVGLLGRLYWATVGNHHSRQMFLPSISSRRWWAEVFHEAKWYAFIAKSPKKYIGHNPLATLAMHTFLWSLVFMIFTGFALYGEGEGIGSWQFKLFSSWIIPLFGNSQWLHTYHHLVMWAIVVFVIVHVYAAVREDIMSRQSIVSTMISGWRTFKDNTPADDQG